MNKLMQAILGSCERATMLVEKGCAGELSFFEKWQLKLHIGVCSYCKDYKKDSELMDKMMDKNCDEILKSTDKKLSEDCKERMRNSIADNLK